MPKTTEERLIEWKRKIKLGILYQSQYGHSSKWPRFERYFEGNWGQGTLPVNLIFAFGKSLLPHVYNRNPRATLTSRIPGRMLQTKAAEGVLSWLVDETGVKKQIKRQCQDSYLYGTGLGKVGYDSEYGYDTSKVAPVIPGEGTLTRFSKDEQNIEYRVNVKPGMPWYLRTRGLDFITPYGYIDIEAMPWIAERVMRPLEDVMADTKYKNKDALRGKKTFSEHKMRGGKQVDTEGSVPDKMWDKLCEEEEWVEIWEIRDLRARKVYAITMDHDKFLREDVDTLQVEGLPYQSLIFNESGFGFWGISDCQIIEPQQLELNEIRTQAQAHRRLCLIKAMGKRGVLTKEAIAKFLSGEVMPYIEVDTADDIRTAIMMLTPHVPPDFVPLTAQIMEDVMQMLGSSRNQRGDYNTGRRTATEAQIVQIASQIRLNERRDATADLFTAICRKYLQYVFTFWRNSSKVIDIIGIDGAKYWVQYSGAAIEGEYDIRVNPDDSLPITRQTRRMEAKELYQITAQDPTINRVEMTRQLLSQYEWLNPDLLLAPREGWGNNPEQPMPIDALQRALMQGSHNANIPV
jgi:DNA-binding PadR family transcriptional regulator